MGTRLREAWATLAVRLYASKDLLEQIESLMQGQHYQSLSTEKLQRQMRLLHCGLDLAYRAIESKEISELMGDEEIPF
ncbi:MAG: hypothetical protein WCD18_05640 [Thermosynechococcaceae cyanobacterium]